MLMHARHVRAIPSGVFAEPLKAATDNVFPQEGQVFSVIMMSLGKGGKGEFMCKHRRVKVARAASRFPPWVCNGCCPPIEKTLLLSSLAHPHRHAQRDDAKLLDHVDFPQDLRQAASGWRGDLPEYRPTPYLRHRPDRAK
jgi:hypothetical protein